MAGVGLAGNLMVLVLALTQSLGVGATALISQAIGRKDRRHAELVFSQALATLPPLASSSVPLLIFALPGYLMSRQPGFQLWQLWYLSVASLTIQLCVNLWLLHRDFARRLPALAHPRRPSRSPPGPEALAGRLIRPTLDG